LPQAVPKCYGDSAPAPSGANQPIRQRSDLTFKQNRHHGRHGWLRLTPAYSVRLVEQLLDEHAADAEVIFDPFSGSGTTALCAAYRGKTGVATDINPFLVWLARAKAGAYDLCTLQAFAEVARATAISASDDSAPFADPPPLSNIERWWEPATLVFVRRLQAAIDAHAAAGISAEIVTLLNVAFCRTIMKLSNAAFNHQSMSFKAAAAAPGAGSFVAQFLDDAAHIGASAADNPRSAAEYILADARDGVQQWQGRVDLLITSPPYPNRMSYIRELRPYMYWLRFLSTGRQAGELDWQAIGGTWGVATSRLAEWEPRHTPSADLQRVLLRIRSAHLKNGPLLANYVHKYFEDMGEHLTAMLPLLKAGASAHYIIGNSIFYGHEVRAQEFLAQQMAAAGLCEIHVAALRKRNSKKGLFEFQVSGKRPL
jgi:DNA modification methylase